MRRFEHLENPEGSQTIKIIPFDFFFQAAGRENKNKLDPPRHTRGQEETMMQIEGIIRDTPQPHLEFSAEAELPEGALIVIQTESGKKRSRLDAGAACRSLYFANG